MVVPEALDHEIIAADMRSGGEEMPMEGVYLEVRPAEMVVFTDAFAAGWEPRDPFFVGIMQFTDEGAGTLYTGVARHWTEAARQQHQDMGFEQGWTTVAAQPAGVTETMARS